jgi:hypothetical protein
MKPIHSLISRTCDRSNVVLGETIMRIKAFLDERRVRKMCGNYAYWCFKGLRISDQYLKFFVNALFMGRPYAVSINVIEKESNNKELITIFYDTEDFFDNPIFVVDIFHNLDRVRRFSSKWNDGYADSLFKYRERIDRADFCLWIEALAEQYKPV